jgi:cytochrome P450
MEQGTDIDGMIHAIEWIAAYGTIVGQVPELHKFLLGNPLLTKLMPAMETWNQVVLFTLNAINSRASIQRDGELIKADVEGRDMMSRWAYVRSSDPDKMSTKDIVVALSGNVFAGSDTTAIALRAVGFYLCRNPVCMERLVKEIDEADRAGKLSRPVSYKQASELKYLHAVMKEAIRLHSSVGLILEREVPVEGVEIDGHFLNGGTIVGINPWVTNHNEDVFPDPFAFKPERWIDASEQQTKAMDALWELNFGGGARKCIGRWISCKRRCLPLPGL